MAGWFARLIGRGPAVAAAAPATASPSTVAGPASVQASAQASLATHPPATPPDPSPPPFGLRRPLVGGNGSVAGFELLLPQAVEQRLYAREPALAGSHSAAPTQRPQAASSAARTANQALLLASAVPLARAGRSVVLSITATALLRPGVVQHAQPGVMLCVDDLALVPAALASALRASGVRLGVPDGPPALAAPADFVLLRGAGTGLDTLMLSAQHWREARPRLPLVATGLQHIDDVERLLRAGFAMAGGQLDRSRSTPSPRPVSPAAHRICELLNHLSLDHPTTVVAQQVRSDVALSYRLLRYANSAAVGLQRNVESVDTAVALLGRQELHRWLSVMLLAAADSRQTSRALQEAALARGRLLEGLAHLRHEPAAASLFTVGVLSLLEVVLQTPLADAIAPLRLSDAARAALLHRQGPYASYLAMAEGLETADADRLETLAQAWGGLDPVQRLAEDAWAWAAEVSDGQAVGPA
jgi:c-di-GMP phosphodiesterase